MATPLNMTLTSTEYRNISAHFSLNGGYKIINTGATSIKVIFSDTQPAPDIDAGWPLSNAYSSSNNVITVEPNDPDAWAIVTLHQDFRVCSSRDERSGSVIAL